MTVETETLPVKFPVEFNDSITRGELLQYLNAFAHLIDATPEKQRDAKLPRIIRQVALQVRADGRGKPNGR